MNHTIGSPPRTSDMQHSFVRLMAVIVLYASLAVAGGVYSGHIGLSRATLPEDAKSSAMDQKLTESTLHPCSVPPKKKQKLNVSEAVRLAECFIVENGYTDTAPKQNESHLAPESVNPNTGKLGMRMRRDSLESNAYGFKRGGRNADGWTIVFRKKYKAELAELIPNYDDRIKKTGRAVIMDAYGGRMRVEHQDFYLEFPALTKLGDK